jgi:hypothetical protein
MNSKVNSELKSATKLNTNHNRKATLIIATKTEKRTQCYKVAT